MSQKLRQWEDGYKPVQSGSTALKSLSRKPIWPGGKIAVLVVNGVGMVFYRTAGFKRSSSTKLK
jgi:hypothetical protein